MHGTLHRFGLTARRALIAATLVAMGACGGGGGGGGDSDDGGGGGGPPPVTYTLSGTISVAPTAAVDGDLNDVNQANPAPNNTAATSQPLTSPVLLVGTVNKPRTGPSTGRNYAAGDEVDSFVLDLVAGQTVELEFAEDPSLGDIDLFVINDGGTLLGGSNGVASRFECVSVTQTGRYFVLVNAYLGASIYSMRIGAPGTAPDCANSVQPLGAFVEGEVLAAPSAVAGKSSAALARSAGLHAAATLPAVGMQRLRLPTGAAERRAGIAALQAADLRRPAAASSTPAAQADPFDARALTASDAQAAALETLRYAKALGASGAWRYAHPNWIQRAHALVGTYPPDDRGYSYQRWHYEAINLPSAMDRIAGLAAQPAQRPLVAVIDTGVVLDHPDLAPQLFSNGRSFLGNGTNYTASADDTAPQSAGPVFHGTHVAGTVAASTFDGIGGAGVAPMAQILPIRVLGDDGSGSTFDILQGVLYAAGLANDAGVVPTRKADVINLSLGGDRACATAEQEVLDQVFAAGVIVVAAAGNSGDNDNGVAAPVGAPANCDHVIAVSAVDAAKQISYYSNTGPQIDVAAPGGDMRKSTTGSGAPDGVYSDVATFDAGGTRTPSFGALQGTSMASPHVAGVMALMRYVNPALTPAQVDTLIAQGALTNPNGGTASLYGAGLIDARKAVDAALALAGGGTPPAEGVIVASPSSLDFGTLQSSLTLRLQATAATSDTVTSVTPDTPALTVTAGAVDAGGLGSYTVSVDRAALAGTGSFFQSIAVATSSGRTITVGVTIGKEAAGSSPTASYGPIYVLVVDTSTNQVLKSAIAQPSGGRYPWSVSGIAATQVSVLAGGDLDNDDIVCQRGEPCGAFPLLDSGGPTPIDLTGDRGNLDFQVAPLSSMSGQGASLGAAPGKAAGAKAAAAVTRAR